MMGRAKASPRAFRVMIGTDGSPSAKAALMTAAVFPWPEGTHVRGVIASPPEWLGGRPQYVRIALDRHFERLAAGAGRRLRRFWPDATMVKVNESAAAGILHEAERFRADTIVVGWRGHGRFQRLLLGSVSRRVVERATCPVLVVRRRARQVRRFVLGVDGSPNAGRAVDFVARLGRRRRPGAITVVRVVEPVVVPTSGLLPTSVRGMLGQSATMMTKDLMRRAARETDAAAATLRRAGWTVRTELRRGTPLAELLDAAERSRCDVLVVGARGGRSGVERALLGSVAAGALDRSRVPVMIVR
jgi:nucleotide-binding universal stress UspA family protein